MNENVFRLLIDVGGSQTNVVDKFETWVFVAHIVNDIRDHITIYSRYMAEIAYVRLARSGLYQA